MGMIIKRNGIEHLNLVKRGASTIDSASLNQGMLTDDTVKYSVRSNSKLDIKINDTIEVFGNTYRINTLPKFKKTSNTEYSYEIEAQGLMYDLLRCKFFNADGEGFKTTTDFPLIGNLEVFLVAIRNNMHRFSVNWEIGNFASTETKMITFGNDTCLSALQKICQEFKTDFWVKTEGGKFKIHTGAFGSTLPIDFEYGKGKGLYNLSRKNVDSNGIVNRLYVNGDTDNIPAGYRAFSDALKFSDSGYIEDANLIAEMGLIEGSIDFPDIYPKRTGVVSAVGSSKFKFHDSSMDFDLNEKEADGITTKYLIAGTSAKVHFNTGNLAGYEFEIKKGGYNHATKEFEIIPFTNQTGQKFPDEVAEAFQIEVGDEYVLLDIVMPQTYIANAEAELLTKANEQFALLKTVKVSYDLEVDPEYIKNLATPISIGDYVRVKDTDLGIDKVIRVQAITRDFITGNAPTPYNYKITLADSYEISFASQMVMDITEIKNVVSVTNLGNINLSKLGYKTTEELRNLVFDTDGYFDAENIKPFSIETNMLTVGSQSQQLSCSVVFLVNNAGNPNQVETKAGALFSQTFDKTWTIAGSVQTVPDNNSRYVYAKCSKNGTSGTIYFTQAQIKFDEDVNDYYFLLGILHTVTEGVRVLSITIGTTTINGGLVRTGVISSLDGQTYFNLNNGEIKGKITFTNDSPAFQQINDAIVIGGRNYYKKNTPIHLNAGSVGLIKTDTGFNVNGVAENNAMVRINPVITGNGKWTVSFEHQIDYPGYALEIDICDLGAITLPANTDNKWKKLSHTVDVTNYGDGSVYNFIDIGGLTGQQHRFRNFKVEKGTKATDWTPAPEDVEKQITDVQTYATTVNNLVSDIANDNKITPSEKQSLKKEYDIIIAEKPQIQAQANTYGVNTTDYINAYNALIIYTNPLLVNLNTTDDIVGSVLRNTFNNYYAIKVNLLKAITDRVNDNFSDVYGEMDRIEQELSAEIEDVNQSVSNLNSYVDGAFSDGIISAAEAVAIEKYINQINTEKSDIDNKYNQIYNDYYLTGTPKNNLATDYNNYVSAHTNLINSINTAISDGATTPAEKSDVDSKFSSYRLALGVLTTRFQEAIKAIETATVNAIQIGGRNLLVGKNYLDSLQIFEKSFHTYTGGDGIKWFDTLGANINGVEIVQDKWFTPKEIGNYTFSIWIYCDKNINSVYVSFYTASGHNPVLAQKKWNGVADVITATVNLTTLDPIRVVDLLDLQLSGNPQYIGLRNAKLEKGNKSTDWTPAPEDVQDDINTAQSTANNAITLLTDLGSDNKLTASEKQTTQNEWNRIKSEYTNNLSVANGLLLSVTSYESAYNALNNYLNPLLADLTSTTEINGNVFRATFKNYYDANVAIVTAIGNKQIENVQVGGRNFLKNSGNFRGSGWNGGFSDNGGGYTIDTNKIYLGKPTLRTTLGGGLQHNDWLKLETGKEYTYSALVYGDSEIEGDWNIPLHYWAGYNNQNEGKLQIIKYDQKVKDNGWKLIFLTFKLTDNADSFKPLLYTGSPSNITVWVAYFKLEKGNKATDWMPAPEDTSADITVANQNSANALAQAQNAMNTASAAAAVTSFMQTTIDGNVISTGTLQVGDVNGANAMISGVTDRPNGESIRFAAGQNYANKYRSPFQVLDNGMVLFVNPTTGQKTFELGFNQNTGKVVFNIYNDNGIRVASIGSQGIIFTGYVPESYTKYNFRKLTTSTFTTESVNSELSQLNTLQKYLTSSEELLKHYNLGLLTNYVAYEYYEGINFESAGNAQYARFYPTKNKFDSPIPDGIYARQNIISVTIDGDESGVIVNYNTTVYLFENGKIKSSINANAQQRIDRISARSENFPPEDFE